MFIVLYMHIVLDMWWKTAAGIAGIGSVDYLVNNVNVQNRLITGTAEMTPFQFQIDKRRQVHSQKYSCMYHINSVLHIFEIIKECTGRPSYALESFLEKEACV